jgi:superfamily I DNA and/or RNA helicase
VVCRTVHGFQGNERAMVILDTVDTAPFAPGVLVAGDRPGRPAANLVNVAISRARGKIIVLADRDHYRKACPRAAISRVIEECATRGTVVSLPWA